MIYLHFLGVPKCDFFQGVFFVSYFCSPFQLLGFSEFQGLDSLSMVEFRNELLKELEKDGWDRTS